MGKTDRIKLKVLGLSYSMSQSGAYALVLSDEQDLHRIPIVIGMPEAQSIAIQLEGVETQRPLTHDLIKKLTDALDVDLKEVFIYRFETGIFYAELFFQVKETVIKIDSRTSDAIALALRYKCPIYCKSEIMEKAGITVAAQKQEHPVIHAQGDTNDCQGDILVNFSIQELTTLLDKAIQNEEYEKASEIRDVLKDKKNTDQ